MYVSGVCCGHVCMCALVHVFVSVCAWLCLDRDEVVQTYSNASASVRIIRICMSVCSYSGVCV